MFVSICVCVYDSCFIQIWLKSIYKTFFLLFEVMGSRLFGIWALSYITLIIFV